MNDPFQRLDNLISSLRRDPSERRLRRRAKSVKRAKITYGDKPATMSCYVTNLSQAGARIRPAEPSRLPDVFVLHLTHDLALRCQVVRREDAAFGVRFLFE